MSLNTSNLTEVAQKNLTRISDMIGRQKKIIEKERAVLDSKGDTYLCNRARTTLASKRTKLEGLEEEYERKKKQLEAEIELQEKIVWDETHKETPTIIRANTEIESLKKERENILRAVGIIQPEQTPLTQTPPAPQPVQETYEQSLDFALFMRDGRQDGQPIDPSPSYLSGVALGACMTSAQKKKGVKMP